jgi:hypothetical protein
MATLTVTDISRAGVSVAGATPTATTGDEWLNTGREFIEIKNGSGGDITVTLDIKGTVDGLTITDRTVSVAAGATKAIGPFPVGMYNDSNTGRAKATCSAVSSITIKALKLPTS